MVGSNDEGNEESFNGDGGQDDVLEIRQQKRGRDPCGILAFIYVCLWEELTVLKSQGAKFWVAGGDSNAVCLKSERSGFSYPLKGKCVLSAWSMILENNSNPTTFKPDFHGSDLTLSGDSYASSFPSKALLPKFILNQDRGALKSTPNATNNDQEIVDENNNIRSLKSKRLNWTFKKTIAVKGQWTPQEDRVFLN
ncbi:hypothetical protein V6N11_044512 [Hibiscus sabdariffa]|uniref:Uncharacterized protein n=1 Tax=Hibiscus sabdariffa TaxID=183260 RepID=A0ABR2RFE1_9ROSI